MFTFYLHFFETFVKYRFFYFIKLLFMLTRLPLRLTNVFSQLFIYKPTSTKTKTFLSMFLFFRLIYFFSNIVELSCFYYKAILFLYLYNH